MKKCPRCGAELNDDMVFCGYCGKRVVPLRQHIKDVVIKEFPSVTKERLWDNIPILRHITLEFQCL